MALLPLLATPLAALADPIYTATFLPAEFVRAGHMNNAGVMAGSVGNVAATWSDAGISAISTLGPYSIGFAINNRGDIGGNWGNDGFIYSAGAIQTVGTLGRAWEKAPSRRSTTLDRPQAPAIMGRGKTGADSSTPAVSCS